MARALCPCLSAFFSPQHGSGEIETVGLVAAQSPDPEKPSAGSYAEAATGALWSGLKSIQTGVMGAPDELEPHWELLRNGATMRLDGPTGPDLKASAALRSEPVALSLTSDHTILAWKTCRQQNSMAVASGAIAVSTLAVEDPAKGWFSTPSESQLILAADGQTLTLEAESPAQKEAWATALRAVSTRAESDRQNRKIGYQTRKNMEMQAKKREAERRKAEVMSGCNTGMRHTARAMASR